jgi:hypothetical protein
MCFNTRWKCSAFLKVKDSIVCVIFQRSAFVKNIWDRIIKLAMERYEGNSWKKTVQIKMDVKKETVFFRQLIKQGKQQ